MWRKAQTLSTEGHRKMKLVTDLPVVKLFTTLDLNFMGELFFSCPFLHFPYNSISQFHRSIFWVVDGLP